MRFDSEEAAQKHANKVGGKVKALGLLEDTKGWLNLALKKLFMLAVEGGYDQVAFINGEESAARYHLSKHVDHIEVEGPEDGEGLFKVSLALADGSSDIDLVVSTDEKATVVTSSQGDFDGKPLADVVGKELAEKIVAEARSQEYEAAQWEMVDAPGSGVSIIDPNGDWLRNAYGDIEVFENWGDAKKALRDMLLDERRRGERGHSL